MQDIEIIKEEDKRENYDVQGMISWAVIIKALKRNGTLLRGEQIEAVFINERGLGYYAKLD